MKLEFHLYETVGGSATSELIPQISVSLYDLSAEVEVTTRALLPC